MAIWDLSESKRIEDQFKTFLLKDSYKAEDYDPNAVRYEKTAEGQINDEYEDVDEEEAKENQIDSKKEKKDKKKKKKSKKEE